MHMHKTLAKRIADAITFLPPNMKIPDAMSAEAALHRIKDLMNLLKGTQPRLPHSKYKDQSLTALDKLQEVFKLKENLPLPLSISLLKKISSTSKASNASSPRVEKIVQTNVAKIHPYLLLSTTT